MLTPCRVSPRYPTVVDSLRALVERRPDEHVFHFLETGEAEGPVTSLTFAALDGRARTVAAAVTAAKGRGERVLLAFLPGLDFVCTFVGCLYAGAAAVPIYLPEPARLEQRLPQLEAIVANAAPALALTTRALHRLIEPLRASVPALGQMRWLILEDLDPDAAALWQPPRADPEALAFLQYTSGSTRLPRGVEVRHTNLVHNVHAIAGLFGLSESSRGLLWLPPYHDMGLIGGIVAPLYTGCTVHLMSPLAFLERPLRWLRAISAVRATVSGGPNFAYHLCTRRARPEDLVGLDLGSWALAFNGAERVRADTLDRFSATFAPAGFCAESFYPCYGLAEGTLLATGPRRGESPVVDVVNGAELGAGRVRSAKAEDPEARRFVGCGRPPAGHELLVVDPHTRRPVGEEVVGELWVAGPSVAAGYFGRPEETRASFEAYLADTGEGPFLRTGDLGFLDRGQVFVTGRLKDLILVGGRNFYPEDVEQAVESCHPALRPSCAAFAVEGAEGEGLVVVQEVTPEGEGALADVVVAAVRRVVVERLGVEPAAVVLVKARTLPKTSSGKIQRHACRRDYLAGALARVGGNPQPQPAPRPQPARSGAPPTLSKGGSPGTSVSIAAGPACVPPAEAIEEWLAVWLARHEGLAPATIDVGQPLSAHALDSLTLAELGDELGREVHRPVPLAWLAGARSLHDLATRLATPGTPAASEVVAEGPGAVPEVSLKPPVAPGGETARPADPIRAPRPQRSERLRAPLSECRPTLLGLASAVPDRVLSQEVLYEQVFRSWYRDLPEAARLFRNVGVARRRCFYGPEEIRGFAELPTGDRMALWKEGALTLGRRSMKAALGALDPEEIGSLVMVSCTGYDTPSPDLLLAGEFGLRSALRRTFIGHMGCFAAFRGIQVALDALAARPDETVLVTCTELCSIHVRSEATAEQAVCHALFGDASASLVLGQAPAGAGPQILTTRSEILYAEAEHMGWTVTNTGFRMFLSPAVPDILAREVEGFVARLLAPLRLGRSDVEHWGIHPGGPKIVELVAEALAIGERGRRPALTVLREHGNCSSPTVLLVLEHILQKEAPRPGEYGVLLAFGPGLTMEGLVLRF